MFKTVEQLQKESGWDDSSKREFRALAHDIAATHEVFARIAYDSRSPAVHGILKEHRDWRFVEQVVYPQLNLEYALFRKKGDQRLIMIVLS